MDLDALYFLLTQEDLKERHLAVVSIAGCLRTGKSFLMNFLMRYMQEAGWQNPGWIGDDDTAAENCMEWKSGRNAHTKGIIIWKEIFKIEKPGLESEKLAVLFMDTQGLFDRTMTKEDNVKLFAWTMMLSSSIMLNIRSGIDERELEYLQFYVDYAKAMKKSDQEKKPFQDLLFLIRDWQCSNFYGINEGKCHLEESLAPSSKRGLDVKRKNLCSSFETLSCFLLPHPGIKVTKEEFTGHNRDISPEFLRCVKELAELILNPVNVKKKTHHGKPLTGYALWDLLVGCDNAFKDGQLPTVESMSVALAKARNEIFLHESMKIYKEAMDKIRDGAKLSDDELKSMHAKAQKVALERFEEKTDFDGEEIRVDYRERLVEECQYAFNSLRTLNNIHMRNARIFSEDKIRELWSAYREEMSEVTKKNCYESEKLELEHDRCRDEALRRYQVEAGEVVSYFLEHTKILKKDIENSFKKIKQANEEKILLENLSEAGSETEYAVQLTMFKLSQNCREEFSKFMPLYVDKKELETKHSLLRENYRVMFEAYVSKRCNEQAAKEYREKFMKVLDEECADSVAINERNEHHMEQINERSLETLKAEYTRLMEASKDFYIPPEALQASHAKIEKVLTTELVGNLILDDTMKQDLVSRARKLLQEAYKDVQVRNHGRKKHRPPTTADTFEKLLEVARMVVTFVSDLISTITPVVLLVKQICAENFDLTTGIVDIIALSTGAAIGGGVVAYGIYKTYKSEKND